MTDNLTSKPVNPVAAEARAALSTRHNWKDGYAVAALARLLSGAADEIDRLTYALSLANSTTEAAQARAEVERGRAEMFKADCDRLTADNKALLEALEDLVSDVGIRVPTNIRIPSLLVACAAIKGART